MVAVTSKVVADLVNLIARHGWEERFAAAIRSAKVKNVVSIADINNMEDYLKFLEGYLTWVPTENNGGNLVLRPLFIFFFILNQPSLQALRPKVSSPDNALPLPPLSAWIMRYVRALGHFLDTPASLTPQSLQTFRNSPRYNLSEYVEPRGGWKTFNQMFARNYKPGMRPIASPKDDTVVVFPADSTWSGWWHISKDSHVTLKTLKWKVTELLQGSPFGHRFIGGVYGHTHLDTTDYHRMHAPVAGSVLENRVISGETRAELKIEPLTADPNGPHDIVATRYSDLHCTEGYPFSLTRGLVVIEGRYGLVAVLPLGAGTVASVVPTAAVGVRLSKGEEFSYFQFGGSDLVIVFESTYNINITAERDQHYRVGEMLGNANPTP